MNNIALSQTLLESTITLRFAKTDWIYNFCWVSSGRFPSDVTFSHQATKEHVIYHNLVFWGAIIDWGLRKNERWGEWVLSIYWYDDNLKVMEKFFEKDIQQFYLEGERRGPVFFFSCPLGFCIVQKQLFYLKNALLSIKALEVFRESPLLLHF